MQQGGIFWYYFKVTFSDGRAKQCRIKARSSISALKKLYVEQHKNLGGLISFISISEGLPVTKAKRQASINRKNAQKERQRRERLQSLSVYDGTERRGNAYEVERKKS